MKSQIKKIINNRYIQSLAFLFVLFMASKFSGWIGVLLVLVVLLSRALYRIWQNRQLILLLFNYGWSTLRPNKFKPYYPESDITFFDLIGGKNK